MQDLAKEKVAKANQAAAAAANAGMGLGAVEAGSRTNADGSVVSWQATSPFAMPMAGALPFLIHWGATPHPSGVFPVAGRLRDMVIGHPDPEQVRRSLTALGSDVPVVENAQAGLVATIETRQGRVTLR